jgi:hypothetical protein
MFYFFIDFACQYSRSESDSVIFILLSGFFFQKNNLQNLVKIKFWLNQNLAKFSCLQSHNLATSQNWGKK